MNLLVCVNDINHANALASLGINKIIVSSKYSTYRNSFSIDEIRTLNDKFEVFVSIYDFISEDVLDELTEYINELIEIGINKFIVNDVALVEILGDMDVKIILDNITLNTNYESVKIWNDLGVSSCVVGRELTEIECLEIVSNAPSSIHIQGMYPIFTSVRPLLSNYGLQKNVGFDDYNVNLYDKMRSKYYRMIETDSGVILFSDFEQCSIESLDKFNQFEYLIIDQPFVNNNSSINVVKLYLKKLAGGEVFLEDIQKLSEFKQSKGFLFKKTLYKL